MTGTCRSDDLEAGARTSAGYTLDEALDRLSLRCPFIWLLMLFCGLAMMMDASQVTLLAWLGPAAACEWGLAAGQEGALFSLVFGLAGGGLVFWGLVADQRGRKATCAIALPVAALCALGSSAAPSWHALLALQAIAGFTIPAACTSLPFALLVEFLPARHRGLLSAGFQLFWMAGCLLQAGLSYALLNTAGWRLLTAVSFSPLILLVLLLPLVPESPRMLAAAGRLDEAEAVLARVFAWCRLDLPPGRLRLQGVDVQASAACGSCEPAPAPGTAAQRLAAFGRAALAGVASGCQAVKHTLLTLLSRKLASTTMALVCAWAALGVTYTSLLLLTAQLDITGSSSAAESRHCHGTHLQVPAVDLQVVLVSTSAEAPALIMCVLLSALLGPDARASLLVPALVFAAALVPAIAGVGGAGLVACMWVARFATAWANDQAWVITPGLLPTVCRSTGLNCCSAVSRVACFLAPFVAGAEVGWAHAPQLLTAVLSLVLAAAVLMLPRGQGRAAALSDDLADSSSGCSGGKEAVCDAA